MRGSNAGPGFPASSLQVNSSSRGTEHCTESRLEPERNVRERILSCYLEMKLAELRIGCYEFTGVAMALSTSIATQAW